MNCGLIGKNKVELVGVEQLGIDVCIDQSKTAIGVSWKLVSVSLEYLLSQVLDGFFLWDWDAHFPFGSREDHKDVPVC